MNRVNVNNVNVKPVKAYKGLPMEGPIANWYTHTTQRDLHSYKQTIERLAQRIPKGSQVLEIAPGPGWLSIELAKLGDYHITGLDISKSFIEIAGRNAREAGVQVDFRWGDAANMPFPDVTFDFTFCQAAFKNFTQPVKAIAEMYRVLRKGGTSVIIDLRRDASRETVDRYVEQMGLGKIDQLMTRWTFHNMLLKSAYTTQEMERFVAQTPFGTCKIDCEAIGFQVWLERL
jgi:ubiquinone/menaquinone biosynthesis C-methylase UbiE